METKEHVKKLQKLAEVRPYKFGAGGIPAFCRPLTLQRLTRAHLSWGSTKLGLNNECTDCRFVCFQRSLQHCTTLWRRHARSGMPCSHRVMAWGGSSSVKMGAQHTVAVVVQVWKVRGVVASIEEAELRPEFPDQQYHTGTEGGKVLMAHDGVEYDAFRYLNK